MVKDDTWAKPGWTGTILDSKPKTDNIIINWDNGKRLCHSKKDMKLLNCDNDPNTAFILQKQKRKWL